MMWQVRQKLVDLAFSIWFSKPSTPQNAGSTSTEMNAIILPPRGRALSGLMTITTTSAAAITRSPTTKPVGINPPSPLNGDLLLETANELHQFLNLIVGILVIGLSAPVFAQDAAALYKNKCAVCHGADGKGDTAMGKKLNAKSFSSPEVAKMTDAQLIEITTTGKDKMPPYDKQLTDDQIKELMKFIRSLK